MDALGSGVRIGSPGASTITSSCYRSLDDPVVPGGSIDSVPISVSCAPPNTFSISPLSENPLISTPIVPHSASVLSPQSVDSSPVEASYHTKLQSKKQLKKQLRKRRRESAATSTHVPNIDIPSAFDTCGSTVSKEATYEKNEKTSLCDNTYDTLSTSGMVAANTGPLYCAQSQVEELEDGCSAAYRGNVAPVTTALPDKAQAILSSGTAIDGLVPLMEIVSETPLLSTLDVSSSRGQGEDSKMNSDAAPAPKMEVARKTSAPLSAPVPKPASSLCMWENFVLRRQKLFQEAITDSVRTGTFHNVEIYAYSKRERILGSARTPTVIHARTMFLETSSPVLQKLVKDGKRRLSEVPSSKRDFEYLDDSDLEDEGLEDISSTVDQKSDISDLASNVSSFDLMNDSPPLSRAGDCSPSRPFALTDKSHAAQHDGIYVPFGAAKTWQALIVYLYDGTISFSSLKTAPPQPVSDISSSPKSMYRLAVQLELTELAKRCEAAILNDLHSSNIIDELFNDFTWRYPDILRREVEVFKKHATNASTRADLKQAFGDMALGRLPRRDVVLCALFDNMLPPTDTLAR